MESPRSCPACRRPLGARAKRCLYCGQAAPLPDEAAVPDRDGIAVERARQALQGLDAAARAIIPPDVLAALEQTVAEAHGPAPPPLAPAPLSAPPVRPVGPRPAILSSSVISARKPSAPKDPPRLSANPLSSPSSVARPSPPPVAPTLVGSLRRGGGPFGNRESPARLFLVPDKSHQDGVPWLKHRLVQAVGTDLYTAARDLRRDVPALLAASDDVPALIGIRNQLRASGLRCFVVEAERWGEARLPIPVTGADLDADPVVFTAEQGPLPVPRETLRLAVRGAVDPDREVVPFQPERDNWGRFIPQGARTMDQAALGTDILDLLRHGGPPIRIRADDFDFRCLGARTDLSARLNLRRLVEALGRPDAPLAVDDAFRRVGHVPGPPPGEAVRHSRREVEFTEYVLLLDEIGASGA